MSISEDTMLILGCDRPESGTPDREWWDKGFDNDELLLDESMEELSILLDKQNWSSPPSRGKWGTHLVYFWDISPFNEDREPVGLFVEKIKEKYQGCEKHFTLLWWVEGTYGGMNIEEVEGYLLEHNGPDIYKYIVVEGEGPGSGMEDIREHFKRKCSMTLQKELEM